MAVAATAWLVSVWVAHGPQELAIDEGAFEGPVVLTGEVVEGRYGPWALGEIAAGPVLVDFDSPVDAGRGDTLRISGSIRAKAGRASGREYGALLTARETTGHNPSEFLPHRAGQLIRDTVIARLEPFDDGRALLAGFLIGDTSWIAETDVEAMRRSGLAHFVAVSGSNVALFLVLLAVVTGPLALGPKRRALVGLLALPVYAAATRFEPSVMRASVMAGIALVGRLAGFVLEAWQLLSVTVAMLVVFDPALTANVGFQLSVAATAGVLVGARWPVHGRVARALAVTMGAQVAVAPLLLAHFGSVPLLSPLVNLVTAPLVAAATIIGAVGVAGLGFLIPPAGWLAELVLTVARGASGWPQISGWVLAGLGGATLLVRFFPSFRALTAAGAAVVVVVALAHPGAEPPPAGAVVLDVGQGDAILLHGGADRFALVDGGPEPSILIDKLRKYGVRTLELVVVTHVHADHVTGLTGILGSVGIGEVWADPEPHSTPASREFFAAIETTGIPLSAPQPGTRRRLGALELVVEGPVRRYASPNDQSIVITVLGPGRSMLLAGDIETHAQADLDSLRADVLKVPHQGAGTSDPDWLSSVGSDLAIISVGPNDFGHPVPWVVELLRETNQVLRTDRVGDVVVDLAG